MDLSRGIWERSGQPEHVVLKPNFITDSGTEKSCDLSTFYHEFPKLRQRELCPACTAALEKVWLTKFLPRKHHNRCSPAPDTNMHSPAGVASKET